MSVAGKAIGDATPATAYQPVRTVDANGAPVTPSGAAANADGSQNIGGSNGTSKATTINPVPVSFTAPAVTPIAGVDGTTVATNANPVPVSDSGGSLTVDQATASNLNAQVVGNVASGATDSGNGVKLAGVFTTTPAAVTTGQRRDVEVSARGAVSVFIKDASNSVVGVITPSTDALSALNVGIVSAALNYGFNGTTYDRLRGDTNGLVNQPHALVANRWTYVAASGGISNTTTAVTIKAAAGANVRNYITAIQLSSDALGAATEVAIRDGAGGAVLWRGKISTAGISGLQSIPLAVPIMSTANTLLEVVTLTATITGGVYINAQGFVGT